MSKQELMNNQILYQIKELEKRKQQLNQDYSKGNLAFLDYKISWHGCCTAIDQLYIVLTCYDNPLSNFNKQFNK